MMTINEQERLAYVTGDTEKAALLARLDDMHHALGQEAVAQGPMTAKQAAGAAAEGLVMVKRASP